MIAWFVLAVVLVFILLVESTILPLVSGGYIVPDFLLVVVVSWAFLWGEKRGACFGLIAGLFQDLLFGTVLGLYGLTKMLAGYLAGVASREIYREQVIGPMLIVFVVTLIHESLAYLITSQFFSFPLPFLSSVRCFFIPRAIYHFVLILFIYPLIYRVNQKHFSA